MAKSYTIQQFAGLSKTNPAFLRKMEYKGYLKPSGRVGKGRTRVYSERLIGYATGLNIIFKRYGDLENTLRFKSELESLQNNYKKYLN